MGGSTMKTAKVWRYFDQLPSEEQAAECRICCKKIKATNSSTTGMIRHLRSCHANEYQLLQEARQIGLVLKQEEKTRSTLSKQTNDAHKQSRKENSAHTIANLIGDAPQTAHKAVVATCSSENRTTTQNEPVTKRTKVDECYAVDLRVGRSPPRKETPRKGAIVEKINSVKDNSFFWVDDHPDAKRITNQIGLMLLLDNESPASVDRAGFRGLLRLLEPKYRMPSAEKFHKMILPQIFNQLKADIVGFQQAFIHNNPFGVDQSTSSDLDATSTASVSKPEPTLWSTPVYPEQCELDRVVINSIRSAQNISQSFSHSIQLCDDDSDSSADSEVGLSSRIESFLEQIGKHVFPRTEVFELVSRCHAVVRYLEESREDAVLLGGLGDGVNSGDLSRCVDFVSSHLLAIHTLHAHRPLPAFQPFSSQDAQFLADLSVHARATS